MRWVVAVAVALVMILCLTGSYVYYKRQYDVQEIILKGDCDVV